MTGGRWLKNYHVKTSYIDTVGETACNCAVEQAGPQDTGKTLGFEPAGQIGAAAHFSFTQAER